MISIFILIRHHDYHQSIYFAAKLFFEIMDFSNNFKMLHFHLDRRLYKTVFGILVLIYILVNSAEYSTLEKSILFSSK